MTPFERRKQNILDSLARPDEEYDDASPKGSVDKGIRQLVDEINKHPGYVTTSSCAGRIAIYQEGSITKDDEIQSSETGGKGGGKWLFVSHDPLNIVNTTTTELYKSLSLPLLSAQSESLNNSCFVHFKFEPMILHILCSSLDNARRALGAALSAGFRESGISSINDERDLVIVAIRSNGLAFDSIIASVQKQDDSEQLKMLVPEEHIRLLIEVSNKRFCTNEKRKQRFKYALFRPRPSTAEDDDWEPEEVRRARKRAEGLAKRDNLRKEAAEREIVAIDECADLPLDFS